MQPHDRRAAPDSDLPRRRQRPPAADPTRRRPARGRPPSGGCGPRRSPTWPPAPATSARWRPTARRSTGGGSSRACCATSSGATPASSCSGSGCRARSCSRRSACSSWPTREADCAVARAARDTGTAMVFSNQASRPMEGVARILGDTPALVPALLEPVRRRSSRAWPPAPSGAAAGRSSITLDTTMLGWRSRDLEGAYLPFLRGKGIAQYTSDPVFTRLITEASLAAARAAAAATRPGRAADADRADPRLSGQLLAHAASRDAAAPRSSASPRSTRARR